MRLNTLIVLAVLVVGATLSGLLLFESNIVIGRSFKQVEKAQGDVVGRLGKTILASEILEIEKLGKAVGNGAIGRQVLKGISKEGLGAEAMKWKQAGWCDGTLLVEAGSRRSAGSWEGFSLSAAAKSPKGSFSLQERNGEVFLVGSFPIRAFRDVVATGVCARSFQAAVSKKVGQEAGVRVSVKSVGSPTDTPLFDERIKGKAWLAIEAVSVDENRKSSQWLTIAVGLAVVIGVGGLILWGLNFYFLRGFQLVLKEMEQISSNLAKGEVPTVVARSFRIAELGSLSQAAEAIALSVRSFQMRIAEKTKAEAIGEKTAQVAHDIKSPLAALRMALQTQPEFSRNDERSVAIQRLIRRIQEVAEDVKTVTPKADLAELRETVDAFLLVQSIVFEMELQHPGFNIQVDGSSAPFIHADASKLRRALANLVENGIQAAGPRGTVKVEVCASEDLVTIEISDDGPGFPAEVLANPGQRGLSIGKKDGQGLGLWHASETAKELGGDLVVRVGKESKGASVLLVVPESVAPSWAVSELVIDARYPVVIVDDDSAVHDLWIRHFKQSLAALPEVIQCQSANELIIWARKNNSVVDKALFLCDQNLRDKEWTGLNLLDEIRAVHSVLVTSSAHEREIKEECEERGIKLIHKESIGLTKVRLVSKPRNKRTGGSAR